MSLSRRRYLAACLAAGAGGVAGCTDVLPIGSESRYSEWLPAEAVPEDATVGVTYTDVEAAVEWPGVDFDDLDGAYFEPTGAGPEEIDETLRVETPAVGNHRIAMGSFDPDSLSLGEESESEYEGYTVGHGIAVDEATLVVGENYELFIDTSRGEIDRIQDEREAWASALEDFRDAPLVRFATTSLGSIHRSDIELSVRTFAHDGDDFVVEGRAYLYDEETAAASIEDLEEWLSGDPYVFSVSTEHSGRTIDFEYLLEEVGF